MLGYVHKDTETGCLIPVTTAGPVGGTVEKLEYGCDKNYALPLTETTSGEGYVGVSCECPIYYNPVSGTLTVDNITGNITNAGIAECVCVNTTLTNTSYNIPLICNNEIYESANHNLAFSPASGELYSRYICVFNSTCFTRISPTCVRTACICTNTGCITHVCSTDITATSIDTHCVTTGYCGQLTAYSNGYQPGWGNQTGTAVAGWCDCTGGEVYFRRDNPTGGELSMILDGTVYVDEGQYAVVHDGNIGSKTVGTARQVCNQLATRTEADLVYAVMADNDNFRIRVGGNPNDGWAEIATADDGTEPIYVRQYTGTFTNVARTAVLLDGSGNTSFPGSVNSRKVNGSSWREAAAVFRHDAYLPTGDIWYPFLSQCVCNAGYQFQLGWLGVRPDAWAIYETKNENKWWFNATDGSFDTEVLCTRTICFY